MSKHDLELDQHVTELEISKMTLHVGDTRPNLAGRLLSNDVPVDLTGASLDVHVRKPDMTVLDIGGNIIDDPTEGRWSAPWPEPIELPGMHFIEVEVVFADNGIQTFGSTRIKVKPQLA